jgi:hypothetical protein
MEEAKTATKLNYADDERVITLVADYCQNMEIHFFGKGQPGDTYYYTPKTINLLGIVDCSSEKDILYTYAYGEDHVEGATMEEEDLKKHGVNGDK